MKDSIPTEVNLEAILYRSFLDYYRLRNIDWLKSRFELLHGRGYRFRRIDLLRADELGDLIQMVWYPQHLSPQQEDFSSFIREEKIAALRLLDFNAAARLAKLEEYSRSDNLNYIKPQVELPAIELFMQVCVLLRGKDLLIYIDTNYYQFSREITRYLRFLKKSSGKENNS